MPATPLPSPPRGQPLHELKSSAAFTLAISGAQLRHLRTAAVGNLHRTVTLTWADGGYAGKLITWAAHTLHRTLRIARRPDGLHTFQLLPRRWVVERTFAWIRKYRRCVRDYERLPDHHETYLY